MFLHSSIFYNWEFTAEIFCKENKSEIVLNDLFPSLLIRIGILSLLLRAHIRAQVWSSENIYGSSNSY